MAETGWVTIHRKINENILWTDKEPFDRRSAWIDLIMMANHQEKEINVNNCPLIVHRGQKFTSIRRLSEKWHWSKDRVRRYLNLLTTSGMAQYCATHNGTLITIVNYDVYQCWCDTERDANKYTVGTSAGRERDVSTTQTTMINNVNTVNNGKRDTGDAGGKLMNPDGELWQ